MRWIFLVLAISVTAGGWAFGLIQMQRAHDIESKLATAQTDLLELEKLQAAQQLYGDYQQAVANFEEVGKQLHARRVVLATLDKSVADAKVELEELRQTTKDYRKLLDEVPEKFVTTAGAKLRAGSSTETAELGVVRTGVPLSVFRRSAGQTWYEVSLTGFMYHELLKPAP
jgi:uncharacterized protein HemX